MIVVEGGGKTSPPAVTRRKDIGHSTNIFPAGKAKCRNPLERTVRVSSAQARGKRSCFAKYQHYIGLFIKFPWCVGCATESRLSIKNKRRDMRLLVVSIPLRLENDFSMRKLSYLAVGSFPVLYIKQWIIDML